MTERTQRHALLQRMVEDRVVASQIELLDALADAGMPVHQSTLSRDLRELGIRKIEGRYRRRSAGSDTGRAAAAAEPVDSGSGAPALETASARPVVHGFIECGPNLITVHVGTGQAQLLGVLLDGVKEAPIAGTIAGDDTVLVVTRGRPEQRAAVNLLERWFGEARHAAG